MGNTQRLAQRLLLSRRDLHWNQEDLADKSGISRTYISDVERGKITNVGIEVVFDLASALGVSPAYLLGLTDNPLQGLDDDERPVPLPGIGKEMLDVFLSLPASDQATLLSLAKRLQAASAPRIVGGE